jgi:cold shock CspA family protein
MQSPLQVTFRNLPKSDAMEARIREQAGRLERHFDGIVRARVVVETPHKSAAGPKNPVGLCLEVEVPGKMLVSRADQHAHDAKADALRVIGEAFDAMERQLEEYAQVRRGQTKAHAAGTRVVGRISRLYPDQDYGFIERVDGGDLYFHRDVVRDGGFDRLEPGATVEYAVAVSEGPMGPQASSVRPIGPDHPMR